MGEEKWGGRRRGSVISRVVWDQGNGLKGVTELYLRAVRGEGGQPFIQGSVQEGRKGIHLLLATGEAGSKGTKTLTY